MFLVKCVTFHNIVPQVLLWGSITTDVPHEKNSIESIENQDFQHFQHCVFSPPVSRFDDIDDMK